MKGQIEESKEKYLDKADILQRRLEYLREMCEMSRGQMDQASGHRERGMALN